jgi:hypothetical protein
VALSWLIGQRLERIIGINLQKKCIPFIGAGAYTVQTEDGKTFIPSSTEIVEKWKQKYSYPLEDLCKLANVYTLEDSYQLARLAQFLEINSSDDVLSEMLREIDVSDFYVHFKGKSPYDVLANLDLPIYLTTNYDRFMEASIARNPRKTPASDFCKWSEKLVNFVETVNIVSVFEDPRYKPTEERPLVYHINGDVETPESMVFAERDYFEFVINLNKGDEKDIMPAIIRRELATSSLLFIGYSLEDINFRAIFQGFLSFLSSLDRIFRKLSIAIQILLPLQEIII